MVENIDIDFRNIRPLNGDRRKGFEELVCQLARREKNRGAREFHRVEGAGGDAGVEAYWIFEDGSKHGYQAKYFLATKEIDWSQIDKSVKTALEQNPELTKYTIAIACDLTDRSGKLGKGKTGWEHWEGHKSKWKQWANSKGVPLDFIPWTKSVIIDRLAANTANRGLILFWFNANIFDKTWFRSFFEHAKADLGERYQPEDHVEVWLARAFDGLARSPAYLDFLSNWFNTVPRTDDLPSAISKLDSAPDAKVIQDVQRLCAELRGVGEIIYTFEAQPFPLENWKTTIESASTAISPIQEWLYSQDNKGNDTIKRAVRDALDCLGAVGSHLDHTPIHLGENNQHEIRVEADRRRLLIVVGEAGSGKSHLFAHTVDSSLTKNAPAILLLGQYFPGQDIRREFLNCLDLANDDFDEVLQALDAAGEAARTRLIILIDGLNDAHVLRVWPDQLAGFVSDVLQYEWLAIGISLRPEYEDNLIPEIVRNNAARVICWGIQSPQEQEQAAVQYFEKRGITRPAVPWLAPEFSNFLFLKTCCDALQEFGIHEFPRGLRGSLQVLKFYLDSVNSKVRRRFPGIDIPKSAIQRSIQRIAESMATAKADHVSSKLATDICEAEFGCRGPNLIINWLSVLTSEGIFRRDHIFDNKNGDPFAGVEDVFRFTYQRFSDHLIVKALIEKVDNIANAFRPGGPLSFLLEKDEFWDWSSLWGALAIQIPEKFVGKELLDLVPEEVDEPRYYYMLFEAFKQSLLWRSSSAFSDHTLELFNAIPMEWNDPRFDILIRLAILQDHPWNAELLDQNLQRRPLPERDAFWTVQINKLTDDDRHPLWELIRWSLTANHELAETETLRLAAITLTWVFTASSCPLRDTATKALISIFVNRPQLIPGILNRFQNVDDLYVMERICAAALGAITRYTSREDIKASALAVYQAVFSRQTPQLNINLRDYARAVIEYALQKGCLDEIIDVDKCRPPHHSQWPLPDTAKEEIERIAEKSGGRQILLSALDWGDFACYEIEPKIHHFTSIPLDQPKPLNNEERENAFIKELSSWDIEKQKAFEYFKSAVEEKNASLRIETGSGADFHIGFSYSEEKVERAKESEELFLSLLSEKERKLYEQFMLPVLVPDKVPYEDRRLPVFDANFAKRWVSKKAYEYGWNKDLFPDDCGQHGVGRDRPRVERIGKKYQWLALFEFMACLSDNVWAIGGWSGRAVAYDHPTTDWFVRDVEPSLLTDLAQPQGEEHWWQALSLKLNPIEDESLRTWPFQEDPPNVSDWMDVVSPEGIPWLLLYAFFIVQENRAKEDINLISWKRDTFVRVSTILLEAKAVDAAITNLQGCRLADPSGHETIDWTDGPFLCEYPWRNTWQADYDIYEDDQIGNFSGIRYIRPVARHVWERHLDLSLQSRSSVHIPNPWIGKKLCLKANLSRPGELIAESDGQTVFLDPTVGISGSSAALINKTKFLEFLKQEKLECLWIVAGERNSWPSGQHGDYSCRSFASVYRWTGKEWTGHKWHEDKEGNSKS